MYKRQLREVARHLNGVERMEKAEKTWVMLSCGSSDHVDFADVAGQEHAKRVLEIAAAGGQDVYKRQGHGRSESWLSVFLMWESPH